MEGSVSAPSYEQLAAAQERTIAHLQVRIAEQDARIAELKRQLATSSRSPPSRRRPTGWTSRTEVAARPVRAQARWPARAGGPGLAARRAAPVEAVLQLVSEEGDRAAGAAAAHNERRDDDCSTFPFLSRCLGARRNAQCTQRSAAATSSGDRPSSTAISPRRTSTIVAASSSPNAFARSSSRSNARTASSSDVGSARIPASRRPSSDSVAGSTPTGFGSVDPAASPARPAASRPDLSRYGLAAASTLLTSTLADACRCPDGPVTKRMAASRFSNPQQANAPAQCEGI